MQSLYTIFNQESIGGYLCRYFSRYFLGSTKPMADILCGLLLSMLVMESAPSIRCLHRHFKSSLMQHSLNSYYRACKKETAVDDIVLKRHVLQQALKIVPKALWKEPVFMCVDDTTVAKAGKSFENVTILHDHAMHTGKLYVNGHCFVSLTLCVPVYAQGKGSQQRIRYVGLPIGYTMWTKEKTKLEIAAEMVNAAMEELHGKQVFLECDSWYAKKSFISAVIHHENLNLICNARVDSAIYELPPAKTGRRGRPAKRGAKLSLEDFKCDYQWGKYHVGCRKVMTNIFGDKSVYAYLTATDSGSKRLFFSTAAPATIHMSCAWQENDDLRNTGSKDMMVLPLKLYSFRWQIEVAYYEQKTFWSLGKYMIRRKCGIERLLNLINIAHASMRLLPYLDDRFAHYKDSSPQELRFELSRQINDELFLATLTSRVKTGINSEEANNLLKILADSCFTAA